MMKVKTHWYARPFPNNWEFYSTCEEGNNIDIAIKNDENTAKIAPNPKEVILQGMAACTSVDIVSNLQKMRQPLQKLSVECEAIQNETLPKVFKECLMTYKVTGENINIERVAYCVQLSFTKYCGVSAMIEKSGCFITPKLIVNEKEIDIWDPENKISNKLQNWLQAMSKKAPSGFVLVTGSSRGIGAAMAKQLAKEGYAVIPTSRSKINFDHENIFDSLYLDVSNSFSILNLKEFLKRNSVKLNLLIQNAGISSLENSDDLNALDLNFSEIRHVYETNVFGIIETTRVFQEIMNQNSIIALVSSTMGQPERDSYLNASYRMSKRTVTQFAKQAALQSEMENKKISIISFHPGSVKTDLNPGGKISVEKSASQIGELFSIKNIHDIYKNNGQFLIYNEKNKTWDPSY